ncbi:MAG: AsmA family protein [Gemmatimonadota bacterium]|nr:AsmA family protein [Gemmatimonadota bacterium]
MKRRTRILALAGTLVVFPLALLIVLPLLFQDRIAQRVKVEVNRTLDARVDWRDVGLTFFRDFPNLTLRLDDLTAVGVGRFERDTLARVRSFGVALDLASVLGNVLGGGGPIVVRSIELDQPRLSLIKLEDGTANWDITRDTAEAERRPEAESAMAVSLRRFEIRDAAVAFDNRQAGLKASLLGFDQSLQGDFQRDQVVLQTRAGADSVSLTFAGIPYLNRVKLDLTADIESDLARKSFTLRDTELRLNDLRLGVSGSARAAGENIALDLAFKAPSTDFRHILSLVPAIYARDFQSVRTSGAIAVSGQVKGTYGDNAFPSFALNAKVKDGAFQYPDLPLPARDIFVDLAIANPGGHADSTVVRLERFHVRVGRDPIDATMVLRTPLSDPDVDLRVAGRLNLADVRRTMKLEGIDELTGTLAADAAVRTRMSYIDAKQYDRVAASGSVDVGNLTVKGEGLPQPLAIGEASLRLAPERAELRSFKGSIGSSDLQASGSLENLLGFVFRDDVLRGSATVRSNRFNLDEWRSGEGDLEIIPVPPKIDFALDATVAELTYDKLKMTNARGRLRVKDQRVTLENFRLNTLGGEIGLTGFYETTNPAKPAFDVGLRMTKVDIPAAFAAFTTVQLLAPVAKYARGNFSTDMRMNGALGKNMMPLFNALSGGGSLQTSQLVLEDFPALERVVDVTKLQFLNNPALKAIRTAFQIRDGRLHVDPFAVNLGQSSMNVSGSNGLDQSLQYALRLRVPRSELGDAASQAVAGLVSRAGAAGIDLQAAQEIELGIQLGGTVTKPAVKVDAGSIVASAKEGAEQAVREAATQKLSAEATRLVEEAEQRAAAIRLEAQTLSERVKGEGYKQADALVAGTTNPLLRAAAEPAADQLRKEADGKAAQIIREAGKRADDVVAAARRQAGQGAGAE